MAAVGPPALYPSVCVQISYTPAGHTDELLQHHEPYSSVLCPLAMSVLPSPVHVAVVEATVSIVKTLLNASFSSWHVNIILYKCSLGML